MFTVGDAAEDSFWTEENLGMTTFDKSSDFSICETIEISKILMADYAFAMPAFEPHYKFWINHIDRKGRLV